MVKILKIRKMFLLDLFLKIRKVFLVTMQIILLKQILQERKSLSLNLCNQYSSHDNF